MRVRLPPSPVALTPTRSCEHRQERCASSALQIIFENQRFSLLKPPSRADSTGLYSPYPPPTVNQLISGNHSGHVVVR